MLKLTGAIHRFKYLCNLGGSGVTLLDNVSYKTINISYTQNQYTIFTENNTASKISIRDPNIHRKIQQSYRDHPEHISEWSSHAATYNNIIYT